MLQSLQMKLSYRKRKQHACDHVMGSFISTWILRAFVKEDKIRKKYVF